MDKLLTNALNFVPSDEEATLIERTVNGDTDAERTLVTKHNILGFFYHDKPKGFVRVLDVISQELAAPIEQ